VARKGEGWRIQQRKASGVSSDAEYVRGIRARSGLSQPKFAEHLGIPFATVHRWEKGTRELSGPSRALLTLIDKGLPKVEPQKPQALLSEAAAKIAELEAEVARLRLISRRGGTLPGKLSASRIEKLIKDGKDGKDGTYGDGGNLWLQVTNEGRAVSWLLRWKLQGRGENMGLGSYKDVSLEEARERALHYRRQLRLGRNPKAERNNAKLDESIKAGRVRTVSQVVDEYFEQKISHRSKSYRLTTAVRLKKYVHDKIGNMPIQKVDRDIILDVCGLRTLWTLKHPTALSLQSHLERIFNLAIANKYYVGENPAMWKKGLDQILPAKGDVHIVKHCASLPYKEVGRFVQALRTCKYRGLWEKHGRPINTYLLEFVVLTGVRVSEALLAQWKEFDLEQMLWHVPPEHKKTKKKERPPIPITKPMLAVLGEMQKVRINPAPDGIVFPSFDAPGSRRLCDRPLTISSALNVVRHLLKWNTKITNHGFRSTLKDWWRANRFPMDWYEIQVDHVLGNKSKQAYGHDPMTEERRGLMELWGEYCSRIAPEPQGGHVVKLAEQRKRRSA
jgi:integrase/transcriptional regulator with XRE-family HTH domain